MRLHQGNGDGIQTHQIERRRAGQPCQMIRPEVKQDGREVRMLPAEFGCCGDISLIQREPDVAPEIRTGALFSYAAFAMVMSILACCGVR
jgi:hypothetical protein